LEQAIDIALRLEAVPRMGRSHASHPNSKELPGWRRRECNLVGGIVAYVDGCVAREHASSSLQGGPFVSRITQNEVDGLDAAEYADVLEAANSSRDRAADACFVSDVTVVDRGGIPLIFDHESAMRRQGSPKMTHPFTYAREGFLILSPWLKAMIAEHVPERQPAEALRKVLLPATRNHHAGITLRNLRKQPTRAEPHPCAGRTRDDLRQRSVIVKSEQHIRARELRQC
jgi:hypothetical protein